MSLGWQRRSIVGLVQTLLASNNHVILRQEGFKLFLLWLNKQDQEILEIQTIYANAIPLNVFEGFNLPLPLDIAMDECIEADFTSSCPPTSHTSPNSSVCAEVLRQSSSAQNELLQVNICTVPTENSSESIQKISELDSSLRGSISSAEIEACGSSASDEGDGVNSPLGGSNPEKSFTEQLNVGGIPPSISIIAPSTFSAAETANGKIPQREIISERRIHKVQHEELNRSPIFANGGVLTASDSLELIEEVLQNIVNLIISAVKNVSDKNESMIVSSALQNQSGKAAIFMWNFFKKHYLRIFFPVVSKRLGISNVHAENEGFLTCPPLILNIFINFINRWCFDISMTQSATQPKQLQKEPSNLETGNLFNQKQETVANANCALVIQHILMDIHENREFFNEIIRQSFLLPFSFGEIIRGGLHALHGLIFGVKNDMNSQKVENAKIIKSSEIYRLSQEQLYRYIRYLRLIFLERREGANEDEQIKIYREVIIIFRAISMNLSITLNEKLWTSIIFTELESLNQLLYTSNTRLIKGLKMENSEEYANTIIETVFGTLIRANLTADEIWYRARAQFISCMQWSQIVSQWKRFLSILTKMFGYHAFGIPMSSESISITTEANREPKIMQSTRQRAFSIQGSKSKNSTKAYSPLEKNNERTLIQSSKMSEDSNKNTVPIDRLAASSLSSIDEKISEPATKAFLFASAGFQPGTFKEALRGNAFTSQQTCENTFAEKNGTGDSDGAELIAAPKLKTGSKPTEVVILDTPSHIYSVSPSILSRVSEFTNFFDLLNAADVLRQWKSVLCVIGNINEIKSPNIHSNAVAALVEVYELLKNFRALQEFEAVSLPPLFEFVGWLFQASNLPSEFSEGRDLAVGCLCRMMCDKHEQVIPDNYFSHFYYIIIRGLLSTDINLITVIIANTTDIFTLSLPGSYVTICAYLDCIRTKVTLFNDIYGIHVKEDLVYFQNIPVPRA
ncbi:Ral GTPase-activating protein subunit alpha-2 [Nowakowskiella sp. JEL0407]|nr:Ral GTPase-activating protein subunit alpha-2 [Nowakowskiella sp. JEL0407]